MLRFLLCQVYGDLRNIDDDLIDSISAPAADPNAPEVFFRVITGSGSSINRLLKKIDDVPLLLLWGDNDPWIRPATADRVMSLYPRAERIRLPAGHCPHDDTPELVNEALLAWLAANDGK
jgi:pimeloyl-ACP methyl ester carboxylesterase